MTNRYQLSLLAHTYVTCTTPKQRAAIRSLVEGLDDTYRRVFWELASAAEDVQIAAILAA